MVYIPAGEFVMGADQGLFRNEEPAHQEYAAGFWIDVNLVTNAEFEKFSPRHARSFHSSQDDMPVVDITWWDAFRYCQYLGKRLPMEGEWEKAARGPSHFLYAYGPEFDPAKANVWPLVGHATKVGSYPANEYGLNDMSGNVWQYMGDIFRLEKFEFCVVKGGSWGSCSRGSRPSTRLVHDLAMRNNRIGFRCACWGREVYE